MYVRFELPHCALKPLNSAYLIVMLTQIMVKFALNPSFSWKIYHEIVCRPLKVLSQSNEDTEIQRCGENRS